MLNIALWEPEIPPNTGNIARLCAANDASLHLIGRLGFRIDDRSLRRAGLDYWENVVLQRHLDWAEFEKVVPPERMFCFSAHASRAYTSVEYCEGDWLVFGSESRGLPASVMERYSTQCVTVPMLTEHVRSLNLATVVGIAMYEALRQLRRW